MRVQGADGARPTGPRFRPREFICHSSDRWIRGAERRAIGLKQGGGHEAAGKAPRGLDDAWEASREVVASVVGLRWGGRSDRRREKRRFRIGSDRHRAMTPLTPGDAATDLMGQIVGAQGDRSNAHRSDMDCDPGVLADPRSMPLLCVGSTKGARGKPEQNPRRGGSKRSPVKVRRLAGPSCGTDCTRFQHSTRCPGRSVRPVLFARCRIRIFFLGAKLRIYFLCAT